MRRDARGKDAATGSPFICVELDERVPARRPLRKFRETVNDVLASMDGALDGL